MTARLSVPLYDHFANVAKMVDERLKQWKSCP